MDTAWKAWKRVKRMSPAPFVVQGETPAILHAAYHPTHSSHSEQLDLNTPLAIKNNSDNIILQVSSSNNIVDAAGYSSLVHTCHVICIRKFASTDAYNSLFFLTLDYYDT